MTPEPLTPPECDLRDFQFMPLDVARLFSSSFHARATDGEWRAGVTLWAKSWHQVPAGSLPDDDIELTRLAELGREVKAWRKLKAGALRGWVKASDGLLYHPVVAEKALEAWLEKLAQRLSSGAGNAKRWKVPFDPSPINAEIVRATALLTALNPQSRALRKASRRRSQSDPDGTPADIPTGSQGTGTGTVEEERGTSSLCPPASPSNASPPVPTEVKPTPDVTAAVIQQAFDDWNALAARSAVPVALKLTEDRRRKLRAKLAEVGLNGWREALAKVEVSPHCQGRNDRGWRADIDFLFQQRSWNRLMEDSYAAPRAANQNRPGGRRDWDPMEQAFDGIQWPAETEETAA